MDNKPGDDLAPQDTTTQDVTTQDVTATDAGGAERTASFRAPDGAEDREVRGSSTPDAHPTLGPATTTPFPMAPHPAGPSAPAPAPDAYAYPGAVQHPHAPEHPGAQADAYPFAPYAGAAPVAAGPAGAARTRRRGARTLALASAFLATAVLGGVGGGALVAGSDTPQATVFSGVAPASTSTEVEPLSAVAAAVTPSVVSIGVESRTSAGSGSGIVIGSDGTILTNNHVVADAANGGTITVRLSDGRTAAAEIVGRDPATDLAVIRTEGLDDLTPATWGDVEDLAVGDSVLAVGSPLGLDGSVSAGIISALHRSVYLGASEDGGSTVVANAIQTDAAINPGNSGGALVNSDGQVVGVNTAIASLGSSGATQSGSIGVGFAIPASEARSVAQDLLEGRTPAHAVLGVQVTDSPDGGALVGEVASGSPAADAGLRSGDVVTAIDANSVASAESLTGQIRAREAGDTIEVTIRRGGSETTLDVTLEASS